MSSRDVNCPEGESPQAPQVGPYPSRKFSRYVVCCSSQHLLVLLLSAGVLCRIPRLDTVSSCCLRSVQLQLA